MGAQFQPVSSRQLEISPPQENRETVEQCRMKTRSDYSTRQQALTLRLAADMVDDAHLHDEMCAAAEIVGGRTYVAAAIFNDLMDCESCLDRWLDELWNAAKLVSLQMPDDIIRAR